MNESTISINGVSHKYKKGQYALENINLEIGNGLFGLLGANGAGKSTLMRIMCSLLQPTEGQVIMAGVDVSKDRYQARRLFGYLPQEFGVWKRRSVIEALDSLAALSGLTNKAERTKKLLPMLEAVGLEEVKDRKVNALSGGMLRRLGVAQALIHDPKIVVMDEPTVGLDPEERLRFRKLIAQLSKEKTIILSTHIVADLGASCNRLAMIHKGELMFHGEPANLIDKARGQVLELEVALAQLQALEQRDDVEIIARSQQQGMHKIRVVAKPDASISGAKHADNITLEEAHIAFSMAQGHEVRLTEPAY